MDKKKVFLLSNDMFLYSGIKAFLPDLLLIDRQALITDYYLCCGSMGTCFLVVDNRMPYLTVREWLKKNDGKAFKIVVITIIMNERHCINRGYENCYQAKAGLSLQDFITVIKDMLSYSGYDAEYYFVDTFSSFELTGFEREMLCAYLSQDRLNSFCTAHQKNAKYIYRQRDRVTKRLGFNNVNEAIIFLVRNNLLQLSTSSVEITEPGTDISEARTATYDADHFAWALKNGEIMPLFQPIMNVRGKISGIEVIAHWPQGDNQLIEQQNLFALADSLGLINEMTNILMNKVVQCLHAEKYPWNNEIFISFNISQSCLANPILYWECLDFLERVQSYPVKLMLEITDGQNVGITPAMKEMARTLRRRGIIFSLDYFGTGHSNLHYINKLDLDFIKIDKSFIHSISSAEASIPMLESIINMAGYLGLGSMAVGVEDEFQHQWLIANGINFVQGHLFSAPVTFTELNALLAEV